MKKTSLILSLLLLFLVSCGPSQQEKERIADKVDREPFGYSFGSTFMNARLPAWECVKHVKDYLKPTGGAFYSEKHSNWIVNNDNSSGENIMNLIRETQRLVKEKLDINLENEVKII